MVNSMKINNNMNLSNNMGNTMNNNPMRNSMDNMKLMQQFKKFYEMYKTMENYKKNNSDEGILPRQDITLYQNNYRGSGQSINVLFRCSNGLKILIVASSNNTIQELLNMYCLRLGLLPNVIDNDIIFILNQEKINLNCKTKLCEINYLSEINVLDLGSILGGSKL